MVRSVCVWAEEDEARASVRSEAACPLLNIPHICFTDRPSQSPEEARARALRYVRPQPRESMREANDTDSAAIDTRLDALWGAS